MNLPFLVAFLNDRLSISSNNLLQKSLYMSLQSVEFIAMLRVLSILYISVGLELRALRSLSGNVQNLAKYDFGVLDIGDVVDTLESVMEEVAENGKLFLNEDFIMNIFLTCGIQLIHLMNT